MSKLAKQSVKSSWTPLNNEEANRKWSATDNGSKSNMTTSHKPSFQPNMMYEERRVLVGKWFEKWNDVQRRQIIEDLLAKCKVRQIEFMGDLVNQRRPVHHDDFTRHLPRVLSLYVFSFLDPRSLSRCARVCWHWHNLTEVDQLWLPKCVRLGWMLSFSPSPYEVGIWKRFYIENVSQLKAIRPKDPLAPKVDKLNLETNGYDNSRPNTGRRRTPRPQSAGRPHTASARPQTGSGSRPSTPSARPKHPPWRGSDNIPQDIWRNNILDNDDDVEKVTKLRKKGMLVGNETAEMLKRVKTKLNTGQKNQSSIARSRSISGLQPGTPGERPAWADSKPEVNGTSSPEKNEASRTKPVKAMPKKARTPRDPPTSELFPDRPWEIPDNDEYDSD